MFGDTLHSIAILTVPAEAVFEAVALLVIERFLFNFTWKPPHPHLLKKKKKKKKRRRRRKKKSFDGSHCCFASHIQKLKIST